MKPYGIKRKLVYILEWWAGSKTSTGNKTSSKLKKDSRRRYKKIERARSKRDLYEDYYD